MNSFDYYRNKNILGELTLEDLRETVSIEGDFTIGEHWLPIVRSRVSLSPKGDILGLFMDSLETRDPELVIPLDTKVSVADNMVSMRIGWIGHPNGRLVRIRLYSAPEWIS